MTGQDEMQRQLLAAHRALRYRELRDLFHEFRQTDEKRLAAALNQLLSSDDDDQCAALGIAVSMHAGLPKSQVLSLLNSGSEAVFERAATYCETHPLSEGAPHIANRLSSLSDFNVIQRAIGALCKLQYFDAIPEIDRYFDTHIKNWPLLQADYLTLMQHSIPLEEVPTAQFPGKNVALFMPDGLGQTGFPESRTQGPSCPSCEYPLVRLFQVPSFLFPGPDVLVYHCERCVFHSPLFVHNQGNDSQVVLRKPRADVLEEADRLTVPDCAIRWVDAKHLGGSKEFRSFLGGRPVWEQRSARPKCPRCRRKMLFVLQIQSDHSVIAAADFGYGGTMYLHHCSECQVVAQTYQVD